MRAFWDQNSNIFLTGTNGPSSVQALLSDLLLGPSRNMSLQMGHLLSIARALPLQKTKAELPGAPTPRNAIAAPSNLNFTGADYHRRRRDKGQDVQAGHRTWV